MLNFIGYDVDFEIILEIDWIFMTYWQEAELNPSSSIYSSKLTNNLVSASY